MTLEEMGADYLAQAEALLPRIEKTKKELMAAALANSHDYGRLRIELINLQNMYDELTDTGWQLFNYYKHTGGEHDDRKRTTRSGQQRNQCYTYHRSVVQHRKSIIDESQLD